MSYRFDASLRERLAAHLAAHPRRRHTDPALRRAAVVLIAADAGDGSAALLLTLRPMRMRRHANQFAFPGGRLDQGETATQAALRETREEINLDLAPDMLLGRLDDFPTRSGFVITPLVAWAPGELALRANPEEVARIHRIRFHDLELPGSPQFVAIPESDRPVIRYPLLDTLIHAPTAALMYQFMEVAVHGRDTRVAHLEQPVWAWR
ncbi:MAG: CoA pyrophosphatase [Burkholderiales bacterium]|nr:CoA pyrophosphatase [Burkholderiales bacterium]